MLNKRTLINNRNLIRSFILFFVLIGNLVPDTNKLIAVTTKTKGDVSFRSWDAKDFNDLKPAKVLNDGDHIQTGSDGFGALVYLDDKSTIIEIKEKLVANMSAMNKYNIAESILNESFVIRESFSNDSMVVKFKKCRMLAPLYYESGKT